MAKSSVRVHSTTVIVWYCIVRAKSSAHNYFLVDVAERLCIYEFKSFEANTDPYCNSFFKEFVLPTLLLIKLESFYYQVFYLLG